MKQLAVAVALLACSGEGEMAARTLVRHQGPVHSGEGFRTAGQVGGQSFAAYQPPDQLTRPVPTTVPLGHAIGLLSLGATLTANRAYISRIKNIDDDIDVATVIARAGTPAAGTETAGVALYEVLPQHESAGARARTAYSLRLLPGCAWFASVTAGDSIPGFRPTIPTTLQRSRSYAAAVVWSTNTLLGDSGDVLNTFESRGMMTKNAVTLATGFPSVLPVDVVQADGVTLSLISFRVNIEPARPTTLYTDFY